MRVGFSLNVDINDADSGKHKFFIRLANELRKNNIIVDNRKHDIFLRLPGTPTSSQAKINILRLDGLIMNTRWRYKEKNKKIMKSIKNSDAIIYQGEFCKKAYDKFLNVKKYEYKIISNGASKKEFLNRNVKNYFLANCKWRPHKRLKEIVKSFLIALDLGLDSDLIITGNPDYKFKHNRIKYLKWQKIDKLKELLSGAIASLHLTWIDWCPNSMVEAIVAGCPVIYSKSGGHNDLGLRSGIGIKDVEWNFKPTDLYSPPKLNREEIAKAMIKIKNKEIKMPIREDLYIQNICKKYIDFFNKLLKSYDK